MNTKNVLNEEKGNGVLADVVQRTFLFTGIYEGEKFEIKVTEQDRESAIAYFEINYPWHTWRQTEEVS